MTPRLVLDSIAWNDCFEEVDEDAVPETKTTNRKEC